MEILEIITIEDYKTYFANAKESNATIQSAINLTFLQLDTLCSKAISQRWNITDTTSPLYLDATKKSYIKDAFIIQTQYNLANNMDYSQGSEMYSMGSNSYSNSRPMRDQINRLVYELLQKAGVYYNNEFMSTKYVDACPTLKSDGTCDINDFITYEVGDLRYIKTKQSLDKANKFVSFDQNGNVVFREIILNDLEDQVEKNTNDIKTINGQITTLNEQTSQNTSSISLLQDQVNDIDTNVANLTTSVNNKLEVSNIIAGDNITLNTSGNNITINATSDVQDITLTAGTNITLNQSGTNYTINSKDESCDSLVFTKTIQMYQWNPDTQKLQNTLFRVDGVNWQDDPDLAPYIKNADYSIDLYATRSDTQKGQIGINLYTNKGTSSALYFTYTKIASFSYNQWNYVSLNCSASGDTFCGICDFNYQENTIKLSGMVYYGGWFPIRSDNDAASTSPEPTPFNVDIRVYKKGKINTQ